MTFLDGSLETLRPSRQHEHWKSNIARLLELYAFRKDLDLYGYGSTTLRDERAERGCEPDECYTIGAPMGDVPDIAIEVIHSTPLLDKLEVHRGFGVAEVWAFRKGAFTIHLLQDGAYVIAPRSALLPELDVELLARFVVREDMPQAVREWDAAIA
jgi:Uma2 family endonuclease